MCLCSYADFLVGDSVQEGTQVHVFGPIAQQRAEIEEFLAVVEDLRDHAAHREDVRAPATGNTVPRELLDVAGLVGREDSVRVAGRVGVDDVAARVKRSDEANMGCCTIRSGAK